MNELNAYLNAERIHALYGTRETERAAEQAAIVYYESQDESESILCPVGVQICDRPAYVRAYAMEIHHGSI